MMEEVLPYEFKEKFNCVKVNDMYISCWYINGYIKKLNILDGLQELEKYAQICINISKVNSGEFLKKITNAMAIASSEKRDTKSEQVDIDILNKAETEAKTLRYMIQVKNEDVFEVTTFIYLNDNSMDSLNRKVKMLQNLAYSKGFLIFPMNFKQKTAYLLGLPSLEKNLIYSVTNRIFTTSSLASFFPFYTNSYMQENGIYLGDCEKEKCVIDFLNEANNNKNMVVFGSSGAGKSFFTKLMMLQYLYRGVKQVVIDPEGEYIQLAKTLGQRVVTKNDYNILEIAESFVLKHPNDFLEKKVQNVLRMLNVDEIFENPDKVKMVEECIYALYEKKDIFNDVPSMYRGINKEKIYSKRKYLDYTDFPLIVDMIDSVQNATFTKTEKTRLIKSIKAVACLNYSCLEETDLIVYDLKNMDKVYIEMIMEKLEEYFAPDYLIYIDEMWKLVSYGENTKIVLQLVDMFKTIRKQGAGIIAVTQDVNDVLSFDSGGFGKSILNNAFTKVFFKMEYLDIENMKNLVNNQEEFYSKIKSLNRGNALVDFGGTSFMLEVKAGEFESKLITGGNK